MEHTESTREPSGRAASPVRGRFELVDHFGSPVTEHSFGDRHLLVFFGFSHCKVVCPRELTKLGEAVRMLGELSARIAPLYITVDPKRDDPAVLRSFLARYPGRFTGLTGTVEQVESAKANFRVFARQVADAQAPGGYVVPHTAFAYLLGSGGQYQAHFPQSLDAETVAARVREHLSVGHE